MAVVDEIKSRLDILDVVSQYAQLQRSGGSYKALCPFHTEKTASFFVFPDRQSWRCFGACASGGDVFSFVMRMENLDFGDALRKLAQRSGVNLGERSGPRPEEDPLYRINEDSREYFCDFLASRERGAGAMAYLKKRGLTQETIDKFQLGLSGGDGTSLRDFLASKGYTLEQLALAGVVTQSANGEYRDMFRRRLVIPIRDAEGRLAGFGGRALDDSHPKYLNSARNPIFDKGRLLYALYLARDAIREKGIVIVEGYMDAIVAHQHGFSNVVASMGTALTQQQAALVHRLMHRLDSAASGSIVLALDPDVAGQEATLRSLDSSWNVFQTRPVGRFRGTTLYERRELPSLKVAPLPEGKDPDEIILESPEHWARLVENAVPFLDYLFNVLASRLDLSTPQGKARLAELLFPLVAATHEPFQQDYYFQRLAALLEVSVATLQASVGSNMAGGQSARRRSAESRQGRGAQPTGARGDGAAASLTPFSRLDHDPLEEYCITLMLRNPQLGQPGEGWALEDASHRAVSEAASGDDGGDATRGPRLEYFRRVENREVFTNWMKCSKLEALTETLDEELKEHLDYLLAKALPPADRKQLEADFSYCVRRLEERYLRDLNVEEEARLSQAGPEERDEQEHKIIQLSERLNRIFRE